jgi:hypothetical protein
MTASNSNSAPPASYGFPAPNATHTGPVSHNSNLNQQRYGYGMMTNTAVASASASSASSKANPASAVMNQMDIFAASNPALNRPLAIASASKTSSSNSAAKVFSESKCNHANAGILTIKIRICFLYFRSLLTHSPIYQVGNRFIEKPFD